MYLENKRNGFKCNFLDCVQDKSIIEKKKFLFDHKDYSGKLHQNWSKKLAMDTNGLME